MPIIYSITITKYTASYCTPDYCHDTQWHILTFFGFWNVDSCLMCISFRIVTMVIVQLNSSKTGSFGFGDKFHTIINIRNEKTFLQDLLEILDDIFHRYYMSYDSHVQINPTAKEVSIDLFWQAHWLFSICFIRVEVIKHFNFKYWSTGFRISRSKLFWEEIQSHTVSIVFSNLKCISSTGWRIPWGFSCRGI